MARVAGAERPGGGLFWISLLAFTHAKIEAKLFDLGLAHVPPPLGSGAGHCLRLLPGHDGVPGSWSTRIDFEQALENRPR